MDHGPAAARLASGAEPLLIAEMPVNEVSTAGSSPPFILSATPAGMGARFLELRVTQSAHHGLQVAGIPERDAREVATRATAALHPLRGLVPRLDLTVTVSPSVTPSFPGALDLPVALACLRHLGALPPSSLDGWLAVGELSLAGAVHSTRGLLAIAEAALAAGSRKLMVPAHMAAEATIVPGLQVAPVSSLSEAVELLTKPEQLHPLSSAPPASEPQALDFADIPGREDVKTGLAVAAAGGHAVLLRGPCGSGKTKLARRFTGLLPSLSRPEAVETTKLYSYSGLLMEGSGCCPNGPSAAPHHTVSAAGLAGGGVLCRPGEASLAHNGVLFLDELPEFRRATLDPLSIPLEHGQIQLSRPGLDVTFVARFHLLAAMNRCPCGNAGNPPAAGQRCRCTPEAIRGYHHRIPPFLAQRFDITLDVPPPPRREDCPPPAPTIDFRARVESARKRQAHRYAGLQHVTQNGQLSAPLVSKFCSLSRSEVAGVRVRAPAAADDVQQPVDAVAHVDGLGRQVDADRFRKQQHGGLSD